VHIEYTPDFFFRTDILPFFSKGLLLDTGVLYLFLIGKHAPDKLSNMGYSKEDFDYLQKFLETITIKKLVITPHIFTEFYKHVQTAFSGESFGARRTGMKLTICFPQNMKTSLLQQCRNRITVGRIKFTT
jgi:hypothetical protein